MSVNSKMTALADEIRELSGTEEAMGLDDMTNHVGDANTEVDSQADLIAQIKSTVDNLPEASSGGSVSYDTCTVNINVVSGQLHGYCATCFNESEIVYKHNFSSSDLGTTTLTNVICGSSFILLHTVTHGALLNSNITRVDQILSKGSIWIAPNMHGTIATINIGGSGDGGGSDD